MKKLYRHFDASGVLAKASEEMGWPVKAHHLKRKYGNRWSGGVS